MHNAFTSRRVLAALLLAALVACWVAGCKDKEPAATPHDNAQIQTDNPVEHPVEKAWSFYSSRPYFQRPKAPTEVPQGLPNMRAETCGQCHQAIYEEWKISTHRRAWTDDAQFMAELEKSRGVANPDEQNDVGWMCVNCHTPAFAQLPKVVIGLKGGDISKPKYARNPTFDPALQHDAITCATCHVRDGVVYGPFGDTDAPHPTAKDPDLRSERVCTQCHNAQAEFPKQNLGCYFSTGEEWRASTYGESGQYCQQCHMPEVRRKLAAAFDRPERKTRRHWFGGSLIPKKPAYADQLEPLRPVYGTGVEVELIAPPADSQPAGAHDPEYGADSTKCDKTKPCTRLWVRLSNKNAGHEFPTGDPERHADIDITARSADGEVIATAKDRIASHYQWWPTIEKLSSNRIGPGEHHDIVLEVPAEAPFSVEIDAHKYRMYQDAFEHHDLEGEYVRGRKFHESTWRVDEAGEPSLVRVSDDWGTRQKLAHD